jgi:hypothetical protein
LARLTRCAWAQEELGELFRRFGMEMSEVSLAEVRQTIAAATTGMPRTIVQWPK